MGSYYLRVNGTLNARGNNNDSIYFNGRIIFTSSSDNWNELTGTGCIIEKAILSAPVDINDASPKINGASFTDTNNLYFMITVRGGSPIISNNTFTGAGISGTSDGSPAISNNILTSCGIAFSSRGSLLISNNTVTGNNDVGLFCGDSNNVFISGNVVSGCLTGINTGAGGTATIEGNFVFNNTIGIVVWSQATIRNNTLTNNGVGIKLTQSSSSSIIYNNIQGYGQESLYLYDTSSNIDAANNWWGTTDPQAINHTIYDGKNDFNLGTVTFIPFLTEPNPQATPMSAPGPLDSSSPTPSASPDLPEFPTWILLPLLIILASLFVVFKKKVKK
jgi:parallel beta-helix repeat protein